MAAFAKSCGSCSTEFQARRSTAVYCSATCRQRASRQRRAELEAEAQAAPSADTETERTEDPTERPLVRAARRELEKVGVVDTVDGQLALELARRLGSPDQTGLSTLSKEFRSVLAAALGGSTEPDGAAAEPVAEPDDEVTRARIARAQAREAAGRT